MEKMTMENLINVDALSEEERAVILNVLKRDESLRRTENQKIGQLRLEIQSIRMKSVLRDGDDLSKMCARCHCELGFLFNRGEICPTCHFKVCKLCQETLLNGKWLCSLCYKQRQLKWLQQGGMDNSSGKGLKRWPSGADLVKASIRKTLVIADPGAESDPGADTGFKLNGATVRNGSIHKDKTPQDAERIEYPKDSDKRKLTQLFDAFKGQKKMDSPERRLQQQTSVRRATSRRYGTDTESSSSSSDEDVSSSLPASMLTTVSVQSSPASSRVSGNNTSEFEEIHVSDSVLHKTSESVNSSPRKSLQRKHSYDSDQTIHSDDAPFSKSSTETQIRVEVHSDASSTQSADYCRPKTSPSKSVSSNSQNSYSKVRQSSKDGYSGVKVTRKESSSSQRSTSPEMGSMRHVQVSRQSVLQPGRSPSPYSFDSIPSSHANSPLPRQRILDQTLDYPLQKNSSEDTDSLSRFSGTEYSGTESSYHIREGSSGGDDFTMDDISKVKFHKLSKKMESSRSRSPHSPNTSSSPQLAEGGANCGRGGAVVGEAWGQVTCTESPSVTNVPQSLSQPEGIIQAQQSSTHTSTEISNLEPIAPVRRKAKVVVTDPINPPMKKDSTESLPVAPPRKVKHSNDTDPVVAPPRKSKHVREAEMTISLRKLQSPDENEPVSPPRKSKVNAGFEPISPPRKSKTVPRHDLVEPSTVSKVVKDPDPVPPPRRRSMRRSHEDIPSPPSSVPSSPVSFSGEDSSSERNLSIRDAKRLFEEKERIQRLGKSPKASPRGNHDSFFNDRIWREESLGIPSTPSPAPDDDFEALFSKAMSDLEAPESPLPKIRSRSGSMRSRSGSKSKKRPVSGEFESDSESRKRTSTGELPVVKEPESEGLKPTVLPVMAEPAHEEMIDSTVQQQVSSLPTIIVDSTDETQRCDLEPELIVQSRIEEPDNQFSDNIEPSMISDAHTEVEEKTSGQNESDHSEVESLDMIIKVNDHWVQDPDGDHQYQFSIEEQDIDPEDEQSASSNLWHFKENSTENDFKVAFGSPSENNGQFLEARTTVRAAMGELSHSDTSSDILSVIAEDTEPSETSTRSWDSGGKCSTVKAASGIDSDCDRTMEHIPSEMIPAAVHRHTKDTINEKVTPYEEESIQKVKETVTYKSAKDDIDGAFGYYDDEKIKTDVVFKEDEQADYTDHKEPEAVPEPGTLLALIKQARKHKDDYKGAQRHLEPEVTIKDTPQLKAEGEVSKKVFREKFVKQWLEAEVHSSKGQSDPTIQKSLNQVSDPQSSHKLNLDPYHTGQCNTPGTHPFDSTTQIPGLPTGSLTDTDPEKEVPPKLSPRASSEGSGSLEDSGHVSGTSTQDNTPEHRRTDSIQSQMSVPSTLSTVTDVSNKEDDSEADIDELVASHKASTQSSYGSSRGNLLSTVADSRESIASFYSDAGGVNYGKVPVTGEIQFGLDYNYRTGSLEIAIRQCKDLAPADPKRHRSDPYVKTYLLPDKTRGGKRKTRVKKNTLSPIFDETLRYLISKSEVENRILWVTVWHNDRFGRNDFLGEVSINFDYFRFGDSAPKWYTLQERVETQTTSLLTYQGDLILSLRLVSKDNVKETLTSPTKTKRKKARPDGLAGCQLQVLLKEARNLTAVRSNGFSDPFCKAYLLPDKHKGLKQKTPVIKRDCNPKWNYTFIFDDVSPEDLKERALELTIWDHDKISSNDFLGGVRLNLGLGRSYGKIVDWNDAKGEEISIWQAMLDRPDSWIDGTLILRPNMDKRKY